MNATNQNQESNKDSLKVTQVSDGSFEIEWDRNDPRWSWMNDLTEEEVQTMMIEAIKNAVENYDD